MFGIVGLMAIWFPYAENNVPTPENAYVTEDGVTEYVAEDGTTYYVTES